MIVFLSFKFLCYSLNSYNIHRVIIIDYCNMGFNDTCVVLIHVMSDDTI